MANVITRLSPGADRFEILASAARTADPDTQEFDAAAPRYRGAYFIIDVTAVTATPSITVTVAGVDRFSGKTFDILESAAITATGTTTLQIAPGITAVANTDEDSLLPPVFRVSVTHADADSITYSIAGLLVP